MCNKKIWENFAVCTHNVGENIDKAGRNLSYQARSKLQVLPFFSQGEDGRIEAID